MENSSIWQTLGKLLLSFLTNKAEGKIGVEVSIPFPEPKAQELAKPEIDWTDPLSQITPHFTVGEMITLHAWNRLATEEDGLTDEVKANLIILCQKMEQVRITLGCSVNAHCGFRSVKYNQEVLKSLPIDVHSFGMAIDLDVNKTMTIEQAKEKIRPLLEPLNIRMESGTTTWIHLDTHSVGPSGREFKA